MILSYLDILERVNQALKRKNINVAKDKVLIENFSDENLQSTSYDMSIGETIFVESGEVRTISLEDKDGFDSLFKKIDIKNGYYIKPNEYILVSLNEKINMPDDLCAHIRPRTSLNRLGLIITSQHINASYCGNLAIGIKNVSNNSYKIQPDLKICQIVFETLSREVPENKLYRNLETSKYQNEGKEITPSKIYQEAKEKANKLIDKWITEEGQKGEQNNT